MSILSELGFFAKNYSILIVEDQQELNDELVEICQLFFKFVDSAYDGEEALKKFKKNTFDFDIILSDITMPKINGVSLAKEIKLINREQNIVILSAHTDVGYMIDLIDIGITQFVAKPFQQNELLFRLLKVCENIFYKEQYLQTIRNKKTSLSKNIKPITSAIKKEVDISSSFHLYTEPEVCNNQNVVKIEDKAVEKNEDVLNDNSDINSVIPHERVSANTFFKNIENDEYVMTVMETQVDELFLLMEELEEEIEKIHLNNINTELLVGISLILRKISSIFSFLDELSKLARVVLSLANFLEIVEIENLSTDKKNKLKIIEFIYDDISRFVETVFVYKDTLDISYLEDSLNSSIEQLKMNILQEDVDEEELELF